MIVSCQPELEDREHDPMNRPEIMAALAAAAVRGGAAGIRADSPSHSSAIRVAVSAPIIGIYKFDLPGYAVRITPTVELAVQLAAAGADMIALDATGRPRPEGVTPGGFIRMVMEATRLPVLADISTFEEGLAAAEAGAAAVATTLSGYTPYSLQQEEPDFKLIRQLSRALSVPVIAEGRISTPEQAAHALQCGAWAVTIGSAITRPRTITSWFVKKMRD